MKEPKYYRGYVFYSNLGDALKVVRYDPIGDHYKATDGNWYSEEAITMRSKK